MRTYTVHLANADETLSRASRRILIHADVLKASKLIAGDVLALASAQETEEHKVSEKGQPVARSTKNLLRAVLFCGHRLAVFRRLDRW